jgi:hypothetical protein
MHDIELAGALTRLRDFDLSAIRARIAAKLDLTADAASELEREYRAFIELARVYDRERLGMAGPVDAFWHEHILDTPSYCSFTQSIFGAYLHHLPGAPGDEEGRAAYARTRALLAGRFGEVDERIWPPVGEVMDCSCSSCDRILESPVAAVH